MILNFIEVNTIFILYKVNSNKDNLVNCKSLSSFFYFNLYLFWKLFFYPNLDKTYKKVLFQKYNLEFKIKNSFLMITNALIN